jgi:alpha-N-acetylglucosamine transferase
MMHCSISRLRVWKSAFPKTSMAVTLSLACISLACLILLRKDELTSDDGLLYTRPYALASYLSIMGFEGISQSHWFVQASHKLALSWIRHVPERERLKYDLVLLITDPYGLLNAEAVSLLRKVGWILIKVDPLYGRPSNPSYLSQNHYTHTAQFTKLHLWALDQYRHIIYLDSDMLVMKDLLHVVHGYNTTAHTLGVAHNMESSTDFNAGFLYLTPSRVEYNHMRQAALYMDYNPHLQEQAFLNMYWKNRTVLLPAEVNEFVNSEGVPYSDKCVVLHFVWKTKPWFFCPYFIGHNAACDQWYAYS